jgi:hypothetical protein
MTKLKKVHSQKPVRILLVDDPPPYNPDDKRSSLISLTPLALRKLPLAREVLSERSAQGIHRSGYDTKQVTAWCRKKSRSRNGGGARVYTCAMKQSHSSKTEVPAVVGAGVAYWEPLRKTGFTMVSILAAISSAGMRLGVWNQRRAAPKTAQAAVVASSAASTPGATS